MTNGLRLHLFGGFLLESADGEVISVPLRKGEALLAYLATSAGQTASREKLATLLWGESEQHRARQSLRQVLFALTREFAHLEVPVLRMESQQVSLDPRAIWVDIKEFEALIPDRSPDALARATELYKGEFLADLNIDAPDFESWQTASRIRLQDLAMRCFVDLLERQHGSGEIAAAIDTANRALRVDPFREDIHRRLMHLFVARGMRSSALTQYRYCRTVLERELGVPPDEETTELYKRILEQGPSSVAAPPGLREEHAAPFTAEAGRRAFTVSEDVSVGRDDELSALNTFFTQAMQGHCRLVALVGEGGVGKSHLVGLFARESATRGAAVFSARGRRVEQPLSLGPWADLLDGGLLGDGAALPEDIVTAMRQGLAPFTAGDGETDARGGGGGTGRRRIYAGVVELIRIRSNEAPVVLIFDDLQWADEESLGLICYAVRHLAHTPVLFVGTVRAEDLGRGSRLAAMLQDLEQDDLLSSIPLQPLSRDDAADLVRHLQRAPDGAPGARTRLNEIWALSEGNPRIIVEALRTGTARAEAEQSSKTKLPDHVYQDVSRMLAPLGATARKLAVLAAVIGPRIDFAVLRCAAEAAEDDVVQGAEDLLMARILIAHGDDLMFARKRIRLVLYDDLLPARRQALHAAVARAIEAVYAAGLEPHYQALAHHHREAGQPLVALECELGDALAHLKQGMRSRARKLFERVLKTARTLEDIDGARVLELDAHIGLAAIAEMEQDLESALASLRTVEARLDGIGNARQRAAARFALSRIHFMQGDRAGAYAYAQRAVTESGREGGNDVWLPAERLLVRMHLINGSYELTVDRLTGAQARSQRLDLREDEADASAALGLLHAVQGGFDAAYAECHGAVGVAESLANERCLAACLQVLGMVQTWQGETESALANFAKAAEIAEARGDLLRLCSLRGHRGFALAVAERYDEAVAELESAVAMAKRLNAKAFLPLFTAWMAEAKFGAGHDEDALNGGREAFHLAADSNQPWARSVALRTLARVLAQPEVRDLGGAGKAIRSALADQEGLGLDFERARSLIVHAKILRARGDMRRSSEIYAEAGEMFRRMRMTSAFDNARHMAEALRPVGDSQG